MMRSSGFDALMKPSSLRTLAADFRLNSMPAKFRWSLDWAADEIERLRLTDAEREAVERAHDLLLMRAEQANAATLRGLLERLK